MKITFNLIILIGLFVLFKPANAQDTWVQKANFPGDAIDGFTTFSIDDIGYVVGGVKIDGSVTNEVWAFTPSTNLWIQKTNFTNSRVNAVAFSIGNKGYIGLGSNSLGTKQDFWQYDPVVDTWTKIADYPPGKRNGAVAFTATGKGYVGTGYSLSTGSSSQKDFYAYNPATNSWSQIADFPLKMSSAAAFSIDDKGYVGLGSVYGVGFVPNIWEYDPGTDTWQEKTSFNGATIGRAFSFTLTGKGYTGGGLDSTYHSVANVYEYDPVADSWTQKNDFGGGKRASGTAIAIGNYAYAGLGHDSATYNVGSYHIDWWQYTPSCAGNMEICANGVDDNCNGLIDENCCMAPSVLATFNITANSARLNWNMVPTATKYKVSYKRDSSGAAWITETVTAPATSLEITGLLPSSKYKWKVKSVCDTLKSAFSSIKKFTTMPLRLMQVTNEAEPEVYPNPADNSTQVTIQTDGSLAIIALFTLEGILVYQSKIPVLNGLLEKTIDLSTLVNGFYALRITINGNNNYSKVVVQHK